MRICRFCLYASVLTAMLWEPCPARGQVADWPALYDPFQIIDLRVTMDPADLATIQADETYDIEVPAIMSVPGETTIVVSIRRKPGDPIGSKLSYKIDINEYVSGQRWHGVRKLSLENGDDRDVVSEGFAWFLHQQAATLDDDYSPGMANWANLTINGVPQGLYVNVEQVDESFFKNRDLWVSHETWLYKQSSTIQPEMKEEPANPHVANTTMEALDYVPFDLLQPEPTPDPETLAAELPQHIYTDAMLALCAVGAITENRDSMFSHGKNFYFTDYVNDKRRYFPWDQDAVFEADASNVYNRRNSPYEQTILTNPFFRSRYNRILLDLVNGPLAPAALIAFLDQLEPVLTPALQADPNSKVGGDVAGHFEMLRQWAIDRTADVRSQVLADMPPGGDADGDGDVDLDDFVILKSNFGTTTGATYGTGDFDGDGDVDLDDFVLLKSSFGTKAGR